MEAGSRAETFIQNESGASSSNQAATSSPYRKLRKSHLGGVIFGSKKGTIKECLVKQLFGLPPQHFSYVKNIDPGLPLFLFNYTDKKLHGIFEAVSFGQMNINTYACMDHGRFRENTISCSVAPNTFAPQNAVKVRTIYRALPSVDKRDPHKDFESPALEADYLYSYESNGKSGSTDVDGNSHQLEDCVDKQVDEANEKDIMYMKPKELALSHQRSDLTLTKCVKDSAAVNDINLEKQGLLEEHTNSEDKNGEITFDSSDYPSVIAQLVRGVEELKAFKEEQIHKTDCLEQKLFEAESEFRLLRDRCMMLESLSHFPMKRVIERVTGSLDEQLPLDLDDWIYLVGGFDGLSSFESYSPSYDVIKSLRPMNSVHSYASVAKLNNELYVFGGGDGHLWYDSANNEWNFRPSLSKKKGNLAGATLNGKIFALGGGFGSESFSDVEMLDLDVGRWILTRSMLQKRFALAAAELNGTLYAVGGYDRNDYLKSAERFDPREHNWTRIESMNTKRGSHSLAVMNEKLYAVGGYDGSTWVPSVEIYDPRCGSWMVGGRMNESRGYLAAVVLKDSIYAIGGVKADEDIIDAVEYYKEGQGWRVIDTRAIGRRGFFSAIVL